MAARLVSFKYSGDRYDTGPQQFFQSIDMFSFPKGVISLLLVTMAEVPPVVSLTDF